MDGLLNIAQEAIDEKKGRGALLYDFHELNPFTDRVTICSASSVRQTHATADNIKDRVRESGYKIRVMEGNSKPRWVLIDLNSIVVHVFMNKERDHFQLEKLYVDLPYEDFSL